MMIEQIEIYVLLMFFAIIHELGHMLAGILLRLKPKLFEIQPFGVGIVFENFEIKEKDKIIISLAGPIINILLAIVLNYIKIYNKEIFINTNILLAIFNLIPIYPLDGGRILKAVVKLCKKEKNVEDIINRISNLLMIILTMCSSILILLYRNIGLFIIVMYLWFIVIKENKRYILKKRIQKILDKV